MGSLKSVVGKGLRSAVLPIGDLLPGCESRGRRGGLARIWARWGLRSPF
jgi:hypothetical protein